MAGIAIALGLAFGRPSDDDSVPSGGGPFTAGFWGDSTTWDDTTFWND